MQLRIGLGVKYDRGYRFAGAVELSSTIGLAGDA